MYYVQIDIKRDNALKLHNTGQLREAKELFNQILENNPTDFVTLFYLANIAISAGDCIKALEYYDKSVLIRDDIAAVWHNRGCVLQHLERYADAVDSYDRALKIDPDNPGSSTNRDAVLEKLCQNVPLPDAVAPEAIRTTVNGADRSRDRKSVV